MKFSPAFDGTITQGKFVLDDKTRFENYVKEMAYHDRDRRMTLTLKPYRKDRSNNQNRYYHKVIVGMLSDETGYTPEEMHMALRVKFLTDVSGPLPICRSTTDLSTDEFNGYCADIRMWASKELNLYIAAPNETEYNYDYETKT